MIDFTQVCEERRTSAPEIVPYARGLVLGADHAPVRGSAPKSPAQNPRHAAAMQHLMALEGVLRRGLRSVSKITRFSDCPHLGTTPPTFCA